MRNSSKFVALAAVAAVAGGAFLVYGAVGTAKPPVRKVAFQLPWTASATYSGFYAAEHYGDYRQRGLAVSFLDGGPRMDPVDSVVSGTAQFGLVNGGKIIQARAAGKPIKAVACIYRRSPLVYITLASSGITHPRQFAGKKVKSTVQNVVVLRALAARFGVDPKSITSVKTRDLKRFYSGEIDVWSGYSAVSLEEIRDAGKKVNVINPDNYGVHFYFSCIFTTDKIIDQQPKLVEDFLYASLRVGWPRAFRDPEGAARLIAKYRPVDKIEREIHSITVMLPLVDAGTGDIGRMEARVWEYMTETLRAQGLLKAPIPARDTFTTKFVDKVLGSGKPVS